MDVVLTFFRAYPDHKNNGRLVICLKSIRRHYIRSGCVTVDELVALFTRFVFADLFFMT